MSTALSCRFGSFALLGTVEVDYPNAETDMAHTYNGTLYSLLVELSVDEE